MKVTSEETTALRIRQLAEPMVVVLNWVSVVWIGFKLQSSYLIFLSDWFPPDQSTTLYLL